MSQNKYLFFFVFLFLVSSQLYAGIRGCKLADSSQAGFACGACEKELVSRLTGDEDEPGLFDFIDNPELPNADSIKPSGVKEDKFKDALKDTNSVESFLKNLPTLMGKDTAEMFGTNVMVIDPSRSLQKGQRFLMKSSNSEFVMSFNSDHSRAGGESIEMMRWNAKKGMFELAELSFEDGKPKLEKNPEKCMHCHGDTPLTKPMMDAFPIWPNQLPPVQDQVIAGSSEHKRLKTLLGEIESAVNENKRDPSKFSRLAALEPFLNNNRSIMQDFTRARELVIGDSGTTNRGTSFGGAGAKITAELMDLNHCRISTLLKNPEVVPDNEIVQNRLDALFGGSRCGFEADDLPEQMKKNIQDYYIASLDLPPASSFKDVADAVGKDTESRIDSYFEDRKGRHFWNIERYYREKEGMSEADAYQAASKQMEQQDRTVGTDNFDTFETETYTKMRLLLEPIGVPLDQFSMNIDPSFFGLSGLEFELMDHYSSMREQRVVGCSDIEANFRALKDQAKIDPSLIACMAEPEGRTDESKVMDFIISGFNSGNAAFRDSLREQVEDVFLSCSGCHSSEAFGAPLLPFDDISKMDGIFQRQSGQIGNLQEKIIRRIHRADGSPGQMPLFGGRLSDEDLKAVTDYLGTFQKREYVTPLDPSRRR